MWHTGTRPVTLYTPPMTHVETLHRNFYSRSEKEGKEKGRRTLRPHLPRSWVEPVVHRNSDIRWVPSCCRISLQLRDCGTSWCRRSLTDGDMRKIHSLFIRVKIIFGDNKHPKGNIRRFRLDLILSRSIVWVTPLWPFFTLHTICLYFVIYEWRVSVSEIRLK